MEVQLVIPDSEVDGLARRMGWTELIGNGFQQTPNPVTQADHITSKLRDYLFNEIIARAVDTFESERQAVIDTKTEMLGSLTGTVTSPPVMMPPPNP